MKIIKMLIALLTGLAFVCFATASFAADKEKDKEVTLTGTALCAKCALHQGDKCETVLQVTTDGKTATYHLTGKEAKDYHKNICDKPEGEKVTVTGKVTGKDGKEMLHATKISKVEAAK